MTWKFAMGQKSREGWRDSKVSEMLTKLVGGDASGVISNDSQKIHVSQLFV